MVTLGTGAMMFTGMTGASPWDWSGIVVRLADEGVPISAIKRAIRVEDGDVREVLKGAMESGRIIELPQEDWPIGSPRAGRGPTLRPTREDDGYLEMRLARIFRTTPRETKCLMILLRREFVSKQQLHDVVEQDRNSPDDPTQARIVDVFICKLRKKLTKHGITIDTLRAKGYSISSDHRTKVLELITAQQEAAHVH